MTSELGEVLSAKSIEVFVETERVEWVRNLRIRRSRIGHSRRILLARELDAKERNIGGIT